jgi:hypothetical protein
MDSFNSLPSNASSPSSAFELRQNRQQLERLWQTLPEELSPAQEAPKSLTWIVRLGRWLVRSLTESDQLRVWTKITPQGTCWQAYDPKLRRSICTYSEADLRIWIEQRYR